MVMLVVASPRAGSTSEQFGHGARSIFSHSDDCLACHNSLTAPSGEDVSIGSAWRATMMANSARDPYWQAAVRREVMDHPSRSAHIQDECAACHMPMAQKTAHASGGTGQVFVHLPIARRNPSAIQRLAADGVSCTVCHQIAPDRLGTRESFNANFVLRPTAPNGARPVFGPHRTDPARQSVMRSVTGFEQAEASHIRESELCATCHTLITEAFGPNGEVVGTLPEQMNYQEWQHSAFSKEERSCQSCHMPRVAGPVRISSVLGEERDGLAQHVMVGGNAFMLRLFSRYRNELGIAALPAELEATARATLRQLEENTATVSITAPATTGSILTFDVDVSNLTGHKFPTGYPSRRAWLHVTVRNGSAIVFESGAVSTTGAISGNDNDEDPGRYEPHYEEISRGDQIQIYEPILGDPAGKTTTGLLSATQYLKDSRLLPRGFEKATAPGEIGVYGRAAHDPDFNDGGDRVRYRVNLPAPGSYRIEVELRYQTIGYRWAQNLAGYDASEPQKFLSYFTSMSNVSSVVVATATTQTDARKTSGF
jgi:hypothetical protein